ncbi:AIPR family protein [Lyngbya sp. PCC 8106]|uniref:AIPR family protein n=1 Tax=Lyngbya sp. (strain PCC 8106) TaxID=313612 RepID=UPI0000EAC6CF|nr:AIPR family protein [Lyngbya sp. PCC 8106]EAW34688.1 hypothetical protein L8106_25260 [Lyngbya sp. PCC 8106]
MYNHEVSIRFSIFNNQYSTISAGENGLQRTIFYCRASEFPTEEIKNWFDVNPREPKVKKTGKDQGKPTGSVAQKVLETLDIEPYSFCLKNQGISLSAESIQEYKDENNNVYVDVKFTNKKYHGVVNGGHTTYCIDFAQVKKKESKGEQYSDLNEALVPIEVRTNIKLDDIVAMADGLNSSMSVDLESLSDLNGDFDKIKESLKNKKGNDEVAYHQGDSGSFDIKDVLRVLTTLNIEICPDPGSAVVYGVGKPRAALEAFKERKSDPNNQSFEVLEAHTWELLVLLEKICQKFWKSQSGMKMGRTKEKGKKTAKANKNERYSSKDCCFADGKLEGKLLLGVFLPALSAFRCLIDNDAFKQGQLKWKIDYESVLEPFCEQYATYVSENKGATEPANFGSQASSYSSAYSFLKGIMQAREVEELRKRIEQLEETQDS